MELIVPWEDFDASVKQFVLQEREIQKAFKGTSTQQDLENLKERFKEWQDSVVKYLSEAFDEENNGYAQGIQYPQTNRYNIGTRLTIAQRVKQELEDLSNLRKLLEYYLRILNLSDAVVRPTEVDLEARKSFTIDEILWLLLTKLYKLYDDDQYHYLQTILTGNGIELKRPHEDREYAKMLENQGLVLTHGGMQIGVKLTMDGKRFVENALQVEENDYTKISSSQEELNRKVDEVIESLRVQNLGQEILFEELQSLKELYSKLTKKEWGQILKGKLIDLGISQVINKETMHNIFQELTSEVLSIG